MMTNKMHKLFLQLCCVTLPFLIVGSIICTLNVEQQDIFNKIKVNRVPDMPHEKESQKIIIPSGMKSTDSLRHTSAIGTIDHPTIDGGIINAVDGLGVNPPLVVENSKPKINQSNSIEINNQKSVHKFEDKWATSNQVKNILNNAIKTGKLDYVLSESEAQHLPASVALVPVVESAYKNNPVSYKGAVGSWQLMPNTALENGIDPSERTQLVPSTNAALHLLNQLHHQFGSWELAFAAYNAGPQRVEDALLENPQAHTISELNLPQETKQYVYRLRKINQTLINADSAFGTKNP